MNGLSLHFIRLRVQETILFSLEDKEELKNIEKVMLRGGKEEAVEGLKLEGICSRSKE
jgi:hypothetical protein